MLMLVCVCVQVVLRINSVARGKPNDSAGMEEQVVITDSGELFRK